MPVVLSDAEVQFIESIGLFYERLGFPRIGGRLVGLMVLSPDPLTLDEVAAALQVSKASVSTNTRQFLALGVIEEVTRPGDRRSFFRFREGAFDTRLVLLTSLGANMEMLAQLGLAAIRPENQAAQIRLEYARAFSQFIQEGAARLQMEWLARRTTNDAD